MKLLCVIDNLGPGGAQRQLAELAVGFSESCNEVSMLSYSKGSFFLPYLEKAGINCFFIGEPNYIKRLLKIRRFIRHGNFDAVLSFLESPSLYCEIAGFPYRKWKLVVGERIADPAIRKSLKLKLFRCFHIFADYIVCNSKKNKELIHEVCRTLPRSKVRVIYNIVDFERWKPLPDFCFRNSGRLKLIISASHCYRKNLNGLIDALALMKKEELNQIEIDWYGNPLNKPSFDRSLNEGRKKTENLNLEKVITFYPATNEITQKIQEADAVGLFSFAEGFPNVVCEAMACGKPVICSSVSDIPEILSSDKNLLFDPSNPDSIKRAINYLLNLNSGSLKKIGSENEEICKRMFVKTSIITEYLKLLSK